MWCISILFYQQSLLSSWDCSAPILVRNNKTSVEMWRNRRSQNTCLKMGDGGGGRKWKTEKSSCSRNRNSALISKRPVLQTWLTTKQRDAFNHRQRLAPNSGRNVRKDPALKLVLKRQDPEVLRAVFCVHLISSPKLQWDVAEKE